MRSTVIRLELVGFHHPRIVYHLRVRLLDVIPRCSEEHLALALRPRVHVVKHRYLLWHPCLSCANPMSAEQSSHVSFDAPVAQRWDNEHVLARVDFKDSTVVIFDVSGVVLLFFDIIQTSLRKRVMESRRDAEGVFEGLEHALAWLGVVQDVGAEGEEGCLGGGGGREGSAKLVGSVAGSCAGESGAEGGVLLGLGMVLG